MFENEKIRGILEACKKSKTYKNLYSKIDVENIDSYEKFCKLPIIYKNDLRFEPIDLMADGIDFESLRMERTSGSTGKVLDIYWDYKDFFQSNKYIWKLRKKNHNISPNSKMLQFHPFIADNTSIYNEKIVLLDNNKLSFSWVDINVHNIQLFYERMISFQPEWIYGSSSAIFQFSQLLIQGGYKKPESIRYIELAGDYVLEYHRKIIEEYFGKITVNMYGAREVNAIAYECNEGNMHVISSNVFVEIVDQENIPIKEGEPGQIVVTSLHNRIMPFVRYNLGDIGSIKHTHTCKCGNTEPIINIHSGRITDIVQISDINISAVFFWYTMQHINFNYGNPILQFQVVQKDKYTFIMNIILKSMANESVIIEEIFDFLERHNMTERVTWDIRVVESIKLNEKTGKLSYFLKEM